MGYIKGMYHKMRYKLGYMELQDENPKKFYVQKQGAGDQKPKINTENVKIRVLQGFLGENPKIEIFQVKNLKIGGWGPKSKNQY